MIFTSAISIFLVTLSLFTAFLSGIVGMAGGMVLMGAMAWVLPVNIAMILHGTTQLVSNGTRAFLHREHIMRGVLGFYIAGLLSLLLVFQLLSFTVSRPVVFIVLGLLPLLSWIPKRIFHVNIRRKPDAVLCGMAVTCLQLTAGVSGSALDIFFLDRTLTRHQVIATKAMTQTLGHLTKLYYFGLAVKAEYTGGFADIPPFVIVGLVAMTIIGTTLSKRVLQKISDHQFFNWTRLLVTAFGAVAFVKGISLL